MRYFWQNPVFRQPTAAPAVRQANPVRYANAAGPSVKTLQDFLMVSANDARQIKRAMNESRGGRAEDVLSLANRLMDAHGVEAINGEYHVDNYWFDTVALYVNTGDTYNPTLLYETETGRFLATSWGDWVEKNSDKYNIR